MRFQVIMKKTLKDMFSTKLVLVFLLVSLIVPVIASIIMVNADMGSSSFSAMTLAMQNQTVLGFFIIIGFMWIAGLPLVLLAIIVCGGFISKEDSDGTLLILVSKPVQRYEIIIGKFLAFIIGAFVFELIATLLSLLVMFIVMGMDIYIFNNLLKLVPFVLMYSIFVSVIFGAISTALSSLMKSRIKTTVSLVGIAILIFFGFMIIRTLTVPTGVYEHYNMQYTDVNYHMGNAYLMFMDGSGVRIMPIYQGLMGTFTGTYSIADLSKMYDRDIGALPPSLEAKDYVHPFVSFLLWIFASCVIFVGGIFMLQKREIY